MYLSLTTSVSVEETKNKCINFLNLEDGWYYGDGNNIKYETVKEIYRLIDIAQQNHLNNMEVNGEPDGGITLSLYHNDYMMDILVYTPNYNIMWLQKATEEVYYKESITQEEVIKYIINFKNEEVQTD